MTMPGEFPDFGAGVVSVETGKALDALAKEVPPSDPRYEDAANKIRAYFRGLGPTTAKSELARILANPSEAFEVFLVPIETPQQAAARLKGDVLALVQDARGQPNADQEVWKKVEAWVNEAFAGAPDAQAMYDQIVLGETPWWNEVVRTAEEQVEAGRKAKRRKEFDSVFHAQVLGPIAANPLFIGPNGQRHLAAILAQVKGPNGERLKEFADQYEAWYAAELAKDPTGRARLDTIGPLGWLTAEWQTVAKAIAPGVQVGGLVATPRDLAVQIEASTRFAYDLREIRAGRVDKAKNELIRYEKALRDAAGKKGLDEEAQFGLRQAANTVLNHRDDLLNGYRDLADVEDPLAYVNRMLPTILRGELTKGDSGLETAVVTGDMEGSLTGIVGLAGQGSAERKQKIAADNLQYMQTAIESVLEQEGENNTFELADALKALDDLTAKDLADLTPTQLNTRPGQAITRARKKFAVGPVAMARKAKAQEEKAAADLEKRNATIRQLALGYDLDPDEVLAYATTGGPDGKGFPNLSPEKIVANFRLEGKPERDLAAKQQAIRDLWASEETPDWNVDDALAALAKEPTLSATQARAQARTARGQLLPTPEAVKAQKEAIPKQLTDLIDAQLAEWDRVLADPNVAPAVKDELRPYRQWLSNNRAAFATEYTNTKATDPKAFLQGKFATEGANTGATWLQVTATVPTAAPAAPGAPTVPGVPTAPAAPTAPSGGPAAPRPTDGARAPGVPAAPAAPTAPRPPAGAPWHALPPGPERDIAGKLAAEDLAARQKAQRETDLAWAQAVTAAFGQNLDLVARARNLKRDRPDLTSDQAISQVIEEVTGERVRPILAGAPPVAPGQPPVAPGRATIGGFFPGAQDRLGPLLAPGPGGVFAPVKLADLYQALTGTPYPESKGADWTKPGTFNVEDSPFGEGVFNTPEEMAKAAAIIVQGREDTRRMWALLNAPRGLDATGKPIGVTPPLPEWLR